ncbi:amidohydrolase family protein [Lignipirellula cremea]|nr:amidohydrolase family protein [Lignipirellula cremea]
MSRRDMLAAAAGAAALAASTATSARAKEEPTFPGWIDAHSHIWTRDVAHYPLAKGQTVDDLAPPSFTAEELLKTAAPEGVDRAVLIAHHTYYAWDNRYMTDAAKKHPGRFRVVGMIDDTGPDPAAQMRELLPKKVTAFRITPRLRGADKWLTGPGMEAMWKTAVDTRQSMCCLIDPSDLAAVDQMCAKYPDTPVVIDHFARVGADGPIQASELKALCRLARHKHVALKISAYYALGKKKAPYLDLLPMIRQVLDAYGPERCMWASDCPYQLVGDHDYRGSIALIRDHADFLSDNDRQQLLRNTAQRVYFF